MKGVRVILWLMAITVSPCTGPRRRAGDIAILESQMKPRMIAMACPLTHRLCGTPRVHFKTRDGSAPSSQTTACAMGQHASAASRGPGTRWHLLSCRLLLVREIDRNRLSVVNIENVHLRQLCNACNSAANRAVQEQNRLAMTSQCQT